jgi:hypothetical protein
MRNQLLLQDMLYRECGMVCNFGTKSGGLDGGTMIGVPQIFMENALPQEGHETRIGFSSTFSPFWNQICTRNKTKELMIPEGELTRQLNRCVNTREWHLGQVTATPEDIAKGCKSEMDLKLGLGDAKKVNQLIEENQDEGVYLPDEVEAIISREVTQRGIHSDEGVAVLREAFRTVMLESLETAKKSHAKKD